MYCGIHVSHVPTALVSFIVTLLTPCDDYVMSVQSKVLMRLRYFLFGHHRFVSSRYFLMGIYGPKLRSLMLICVHSVEDRRPGEGGQQSFGFSTYPAYKLCYVLQEDAG
jgi:hypothetical protein